MGCRLGYLEEACYVAEGNVIRHGETLRDMLVDYSPDFRALGMIGRYDAELSKSKVLNNMEPLAYMMLEKEGEILTVNACYKDPDVQIYGFDPELMDEKQAIRVGMYGYTTLSVVTMRDD